MRAFGQKLVKFCTLTHAAKLVVRIIITRKMYRLSMSGCNRRTVHLDLGKSLILE